MNDVIEVFSAIDEHESDARNEALRLTIKLSSLLFPSSSRSGE
ncbi:hypothetical protein Hanom_Chr10g00888641 [Helianthus anomalus]